MRTQTTRVIGGRVNSDGTIATPGAYTARRTATGDYTLTFTDRLLSLTVNDSANGTYLVMPGNFSANGCRVVTQSPAAAQTDRPFTFTAVVPA